MSLSPGRGTRSPGPQERSRSGSWWPSPRRRSCCSPTRGTTGSTRSLGATFRLISLITTHHYFSLSDSDSVLERKKLLFYDIFPKWPDPPPQKKKSVCHLGRMYHCTGVSPCPVQNTEWPRPQERSRSGSWRPSPRRRSGCSPTRGTRRTTHCLGVNCVDST